MAQSQRQTSSRDGEASDAHDYFLTPLLLPKDIVSKGSSPQHADRMAHSRKQLQPHTPLCRLEGGVGGVPWLGMLWLVPPLPIPARCHWEPTLRGPLPSGSRRSCLALQGLSLGSRPSAGHQALPVSTATWKAPTHGVRLKRAKAIFQGDSA